MEQLPEVTILWVRHCHGCRAIDRDHWFEREEPWEVHTIGGR